MVFDILFTYGSQIINLSHNILTIGRFRIPGRPRKSACFCAKARLLWVTSHQEDKQTWENCSWVAEKKENLKRWKVLEVQNLLVGLINNCFKQQKENQLVITKKNNEPDQKLTEIVVGKIVWPQSFYSLSMKYIRKWYQFCIPWQPWHKHDCEANVGQLLCKCKNKHR